MKTKQSILRNIFLLFICLSIGKLHAQQEYSFQNTHYKEVLGYDHNNPGKVEIYSSETKGKQTRWIIKNEPNGTFKICSADNNSMVLEATPNGTVQLARDKGASANANDQRWKKVDEKDRTFKLQNVLYSNKVLDASAGTKGRVQMWNNVGASNQYVPNAANQRWKQLSMATVVKSPTETKSVKATVSGSSNTTTSVATPDRPKASATIDVTTYTTPADPKGYNAMPDHAVASLLNNHYDQKNSKEIRRLFDNLSCDKLEPVLQQSGVLKRAKSKSEIDVEVRYAAKARSIDCGKLNFSHFTDDDLNKYFDGSGRSFAGTSGISSGNPFCKQVNSFTVDNYILAVGVYFEMAVGKQVNINLREKPSDFFNPFFIPFPKISGFNDKDEQTLLRIFRCLPCEDINKIVNHFSYATFNYKFDGSENAQFQQLYDKCNTESYAKWSDDESRIFLMTSDCNKINGLSLNSVRDLILNMFAGHTDEAEENAIIKAVNCLPDASVQNLVKMKGTSVENFKSEFQGTNEKRLLAIFRNKGAL